MALSSLASQLQKLREQVPPDIHKRTFISFLFDRQQASVLDTNTIWAIGREGVEELCKLDERFPSNRGFRFFRISELCSREPDSAS